MFYLHTKNTSYIIKKKEYGKLEHIYYGKRIKEDEKLVSYEQTSELPHSVLYNSKISLDTLELVAQEYPESGKGDFREPAISILSKHGYSTDFLYQSHRYYENRTGIEGLPFAKGPCRSLEIVLYDSLIHVELILNYHAFYESDVITRNVKIVNKGNEKIQVERAMSLCLDLDDDGYELMSFQGAWASEMQMKNQKIEAGIYINDSKVGTSSNRHNPFIVVKQEDATEIHGNCYGFNLMYSGNHAEIVESSPYGKIRVLNGVNPHNFGFTLDSEESFQTPEAVMTFSHEGLNGMSQNMHSFVMDHVVPQKFTKKERPILINNWEATYFNFDKPKLLALAKEAKKVGIELFVLDDGWFGNRNDDKTSLGDWVTNEAKIGGTMAELANEINEVGLEFGLWFEPEMISEESDLYEKHPDWVLGTLRRSTGRNQFILDLTKDEVCDYIVTSVSAVLESANITYLKWDMNRNFSDVFSDRQTNQGEVCHRYMIGLYRVFDELITRFPNVLFEGCSAGGNRFDLGILSYMPQIWGSDDTDGHERVQIQKSISYGYPQSTYGAHVSACPNHQTFRHTPIETRFNISTFGALGYELNLLELSEHEKELVTRQIAYYKEHRALFQFGKLYRLTTKEDKEIFLCMDKDSKCGVIGEFYNLQRPSPSFNKIITTYLDNETYYTIKSREQFVTKEDVAIIDTVVKLNDEVYQGYGDYFNYHGIPLSMQHLGTGSEKTRFIGDFGSRIYNISQ